jgi:hypothetical protein
MDVCIEVRYKQYLPFSVVEEAIKGSSLWGGGENSLSSAQNMWQEGE